jgi:hypothetical protein
MKPIETKEYPTGVVELHLDTDPVDPREYDNLAVLCCKHRRYTLGDEQMDDPDEKLLELVRDIHPDFPRYDDVERPSGMWKDKVQQILAEHYAILPLYLYDHSGISMSTGAFSCPWDSGQVGFAYMTLEKAREIGGCEGKGWLDPVEFERTDRFPLRTIKRVVTGTVRERAEQAIRNEVETYDAYLRGNVYGFIAYAVDPITEEREEIDSCWGFYSSEEAFAQGAESLPKEDVNREFDLAEAAAA